MADEVKHEEEHCALPHSKRKPDSCVVDANDEEAQPKKFKFETMIIADGEQKNPPAIEFLYKADGDDDDDVEEEGKHSNGEADRKGKSIVTKDDKGKGKLDEEDDDSSDDEIIGSVDEEDDDDDDSSEDDDDDDDSGDEVDSDLSDDPLAEVDLDNILPSRTRRRSAASNPGIWLGKRKDI